MNSPPDRFTHLCVHSHFSLLGGTASPYELAARAKKDGMECLALTDTNALYGAVAFDRACRQVGIRPLLGMTLAAAPPPDLADPGDPPGELVLLATDLAGYRTLCRLSSFVQGSSNREHVTAQGVPWSVLKLHTQGILCLTGGRRGYLYRYLKRGDPNAAHRIAGRLAGIYGESNTYLSLEIHCSNDRILAQEISSLAIRLGLSTVALQPVYCLSPHHVSRLRLLAAIDHNCRLDQVSPERLPDRGDPQMAVHWMSPVEIRERFSEFPEAIDKISEISDRCSSALPDGRPVFPSLSLPTGKTADQALSEKAREGLKKRYGAIFSPGIGERLDRELESIAQHGYAPLFLVVADIVRYARKQGIPASTRGSVANSLVAYCAGITSVDPIAHDLLFERFLNPSRADPPDIDLDLCSRRRDEVLDYVRRTYGEDRVALVATINTIQPKSAIRETAKAYGLEEGRIEALIALLPRRWHRDPKRRDKRSMEDMIRDLRDRRLRDIVRNAFELIGQPHHLSVHAGGLTMTPGPLTDWVPLQWSPKGFQITQFDHKDIEKLGLPKIDLLGIRALTVLAEAADLVRRYHKAGLDLEEIPLDDADTAELLRRGETIGVFQCESAGARRTLRQLKAQSIRDLAIANAFFKPGPSTGGMAQTFIRRYRGEAPVTFLHPSLEPILGATKGVLIFQEQILRVAREIAGLSWEQADHLRRGMSKFKPDEMQALREHFLRGCRRLVPQGAGLNQEQAETLWEQVVAFAGYGFNQGHATAYAGVSYRSAFLKTHWPAAFLCARLAHRGGYHHPVIYMAEAVRLGIPVHPPHINSSLRRFTLDWRSAGDGVRIPLLWMGLGQIRDLRRTAVDEIIAERTLKPYRDLRDLLVRVSLQPKEIIHLIQCGALDGLGSSRAALLVEAKEIQRAGSATQLAFLFARPMVAAETAAQQLAWERRLLGYPISVHPLDLVRDQLSECMPLRRLFECGGMTVQVAAVRLPGWTGGRGVFIGDGDTFVVAQGLDAALLPSPWEPVIISGRWIQDEWGTGWFQGSHLQRL